MKSLRYLKGIFVLLLSTCWIYAGAPDWDCDGDGVLDNLNQYQNNGSFTAGILLDGQNTATEGDLFGAFVDGELRGVGALSQVPDVPPVFGDWAGQNQFAMLVYSNVASGEDISFKYYDSETDNVYDILDIFPFTADMTEGTAVEPVVFNFSSSDISSDP